jgi:hypothetical protein
MCDACDWSSGVLGNVLEFSGILRYVKNLFSVPHHSPPSFDHLPFLVFLFSEFLRLRLYHHHHASAHSLFRKPYYL